MAGAGQGFGTEALLDPSNNVVLFDIPQIQHAFHLLCDPPTGGGTPNGGTNGTRRRSTTLAPLGDGNESAAGGPCDEAERIADERCAVAIRARGQADAADEAVREAQRAYEERGAHANRAAVAAESSDMQVAKQSAQQAFRRARSEASTRDEIESAAASWLTEINRIEFKDAAIIVFKDGHQKTFSLAEIARIEFEPSGATETQFGRNHFLGKWRVGDGAGSHFFITLEPDGKARKSIGSSHGTWTVVSGEARISWDDGWTSSVSPRTRNLPAARS